MDTNIVDLHVAIARLEAVVQQGLVGVRTEIAGTNERLDKLNGRVYTGEQDRSLLSTRVAVLEALEMERPAPSSTPPAAATHTTAAGVGAGAAGAIVAVWELLKPFFHSGS